VNGIYDGSSIINSLFVKKNGDGMAAIFLFFFQLTFGGGGVGGYH